MPADDRQRYVVAVLHELHVPKHRSPDEAWEELATCNNAMSIALFATGPIGVREEEIIAPDFSIDVASYGRTIHGDQHAITTRELALLANAALTMLRYHEITRRAGLVDIDISHGDQLRRLAQRCGGTIDPAPS